MTTEWMSGEYPFPLPTPAENEHEQIYASTDVGASVTPLLDHPKTDEWGLPFFVDEWGCETEYDEDPVPKFTEYLTGGIIVSGSISASKITATSISSSKITSGTLTSAHYYDSSGKLLGSVPINPPTTP